MVSLHRELEQVHSAMIAITVAIENSCGRYEPVELIPALEAILGKLYDLVEKTAAGGKDSAV